VSPSDLKKAAVDASAKRQQNLDTLTSFFSSAKAQHALQSAHMALGRSKAPFQALAMKNWRNWPRGRTGRGRISLPAL
jgi:hypothetical protein